MGPRIAGEDEKFTHLPAHGLGSVSEIFDGDAPFTPRGCIAQAWSAAEALRAWVPTAAARKKFTTGQGGRL